MAFLLILAGLHKKRGDGGYFVRTRRESSSVRAWRRVSISALVLYSEKLMRMEASISFGVRPNAVSDSERWWVCEEQAEPLEIQIPRAERA